MVRWASAPWLLAAAVLGLGGLAMAQDGLIVDPWRHPSATPFGERAKSPAPGVPAARRLATPAARKTGPTIVPLGPPLALHTNPGAVVPLGPAGHEDIVDPWTPTFTAVAHPAPLTAAHRNWSWEIQEIVDPWRRGALAVATDPAIVDPWAP
ncbi:MAG TPA: hypothetical protein VLJ38_06575 [Polyangiaceae bacterium]|nr:hypothetical protein [Polyangiaceae bacterium]